MRNKISIFWFRRDLRLEDNRGLSEALASGSPVLPVFIFDKSILDQLPHRCDRRVDYIQQAVEQIDMQLRGYGSGVLTFHSRPEHVFAELAERYVVQAVYCNRDYEPQAIKRDAAVRHQLAQKDIAFYDFKDQVIFEKSDVVKNDGTPYTVYSPYAKKWRSALQPSDLQVKKVDFAGFYALGRGLVHTLEELGFEKTEVVMEKPELDEGIISRYSGYRDFPALQHSTQLGIALRFGTISIRRCVTFALERSETWLGQLIWREFFMQTLFHFPHVVNHAFKPEYDRVAWRNDTEEFRRWCDGETGYPIVDAGMRQLNETGYMHNRVRMVVASFLCKHLLIDWRWGEAYFATKLNDYDLAANNGNWQWAAGCGCDAAPYFRIFNPTLQRKKFDKDMEYIARWNPGYQHTQIQPIVVHEHARERALQVYKRALREQD